MRGTGPQILLLAGLLECWTCIGLPQSGVSPAVASTRLAEQRLNTGTQQEDSFDAVPILQLEFKPRGTIPGVESSPVV